MNNFAALYKMLNIGFIQFVLEEEREYNDLVTKNSKEEGEDLDILGVLDVFKDLMYWCAQPEAENKNGNWAQRIAYLYKLGQDVMIVTFCTC